MVDPGDVELAQKHNYIKQIRIISSLFTRFLSHGNIRKDEPDNIPKDGETKANDYETYASSLEEVGGLDVSNEHEEEASPNIVVYKCFIDTVWISAILICNIGNLLINISSVKISKNTS